MKTSFVIGWCCLFVACIFFNAIIEQGSGVSGDNLSMFNSLVKPNIIDATNLASIPVIGGAASLIAYVGTFCNVLVSMIFLWFPSIWTGNWLWVYWFLCVPVAVGFIVSIVFILRGVTSN